MLFFLELERDLMSAKSGFIRKPAIATAGRCLVALVAMSLSGVLLLQFPVPPRRMAPARASAAGNFAQLPLAFEPNSGHLDTVADYFARGPGYTVYLNGGEAAIVSARVKPVQPPRLSRLTNPAAGTLALDGSPLEDVTTLRIRFAGSAPSAPAASESLPGVSHYFIGNDPSTWRTGVPQYGRISYRNIYPGIDAVYYGRQHRLEYDLVVHPGADASKIRISFENAKRLRLDENGGLVIPIGGREFVQRRPSVYQRLEAGRVTVAASYRISPDAGEAQIALASYDHARPLIIDPVLEYGTFYGGAVTDFATSIAVDSAGNAYITGSTNSIALPGPKPSGTALRGPSDAFVAKINAAGTAILYAAYIGGSGQETGSSIAVDGPGNAYIAGVTTSADFPVASGAPQGRFGGGPFDAFAVKLNATGSALLYSTYLGGSGADVANAIAVDLTGNAYVAGFTASPDFPGIRPGAIQSAPAGGQDGFVVKLNVSGAGFLFATYFGGAGDDVINDIALDPEDGPYIAGDTTSPRLPGIRSDSIQSVRRGARRDAFVAKLTATGSSVVFTTFLGGSADQSASAITSAQGLACITGFTTSADFPVTQSAYQLRNRGSSEAFVTQIDDVGRSLIFSTYLGGNGQDYGYSVVLDSDGNAYVAGFTNSTDFLAGVSQPPRRGNASAFVTELDSQGRRVLFTTYFGANDINNPVDLAANLGASSGDEIFVAGSAHPAFDFPSSKTPMLQSYGGGPYDAFVAKLANADLSIRALDSDLPDTGQAIPGGNVSTFFEVRNRGPHDAENVVASFSVDLARGLTIVRCTAKLGSCVATRSGAQVTYASLAAGALDTVTVLVKVSASLENGSTALVNATLKSDTNDPNVGNNNAGAGFGIAGVAPFQVTPPDTLDFGSVTLGQPRTVTVTITPNSAVDLTLTLIPSTGAPPQTFTFAPGTDTSFRTSLPRNVSLTFIPDVQNLREAQLDIRTTSGTAYSTTVFLTGLGVPPATPMPNISSVVDAAGFRNLIAANTWLAIQGTNFLNPASPTRECIWGPDFPGGTLPRSLCGVSVNINGRPAYVEFVNAIQVNVLAPADPTVGAVQIEMVTPTGRTTATAQKDVFAPGFFIVSAPYVAARFTSDFGIVGRTGLLGPGLTRPARPGDVVQFYLGGLGNTTPQYPDGMLPAAALPLDVPVTVQIGGATANVFFAGLSTTPGLYVINATIPNIPDGDAPVVVTLANRQTQPSALITITR